MERMGLDVTVIDSPWGEGANEEKLAELLKVRIHPVLSCLWTTLWPLSSTQVTVG